VCLLALAPWLAGARCGGGSGTGGKDPVANQPVFDPRCAPLAELDGFPPGYDFVPPPGGTGAPVRALAATVTGNNLIPLGIEATPFRVPDGLGSYPLPADADGDGINELFKSIDGVVATAADLALVTVSGDSGALLFVDPAGVGPRSARVEVPVGFDPDDFAPYPGLPAPGTSRLQRGVTVAACVDAGPDARDSRGVLLADALPSFLWCNGPGSFPATFPAGAALAAGRLFVATSNLGLDQGQPDTQFLPGTLIVFEIDTAADPLVVSPSQATPDGRPWLLTSAFNPTHVTPYTTPGGRELLLVSQTGAIGIGADDPNTDEDEGGTLPISDGAIDVFDPVSLERVASYPLQDANPSLDGVAVDPTGRVALLGDVASRRIFAVDLQPLDSLPPGGQGAPPADLSAAVIFDGLNPLEQPRRASAPAAPSCGGRIQGVAFDATGGRLYALETCDGTIGAWDVDLSGSPSVAQLRDRFVFDVLSVATAAVRVDTLEQARQPAALRVRPGVPGVDYAGPDVFFTIGDPEGFLCGVSIDAS
jgi:hypothetical protein